MTKRFCLAGLLWLGSARAQPEGRILRPPDRAALTSGQMSVIATAPEGKLEIDGRPVTAEQPFPSVLHANLKLPAGAHTLTLIWQGGRQESRFFIGPSPPPEYRPFKAHPPAQVECTQCHGVSRRGRFIFKGGCFDCHQEAAFAKTHQHTPNVLENCGQCHNAHGSTEKSHLTLTRDKACKLCHN